MITLVPCKVRFIFTCAECGVQAEHGPLLLRLHDKLPLPILPLGWRVVHRSVYCPNHRINIVVEPEVALASMPEERMEPLA